MYFLKAFPPDFSLATERQTDPYREQADLERWIGWLLKAGLPE